MEQQIRVIKARLDLYRAFKHDGSQACQDESHRMYVDLRTRIKQVQDEAHRRGSQPDPQVKAWYDEILGLYMFPQ